MNNQPKIFILSPHIDDAAFGLTLTIEKFITNKIPVTIINCFTVTRWTGIFVSRDIEVVSRLRKEEDAEYNKLFNSQINIINLDLLDAPLRNGYIFQNQPFQKNELELIEDVRKLLEQHISNGILLCPLAIGNHIDHVICREAVVKLYRKFDVIFFEDLPYAQRIGEEQIYRHIHNLEVQLDSELRSFTSRSDRSIINKDQAIRVYKSQLNDEICSEIVGHMNALGGERLWGEDGGIEEFLRVLNPQP
ncbi:MAG TPA: PIG-L family deacetylase [Segetibacter sp.]